MNSEMLLRRHNKEVLKLLLTQLLLYHMASVLTNLVCLTMTPYPHPTSTLLPHAPLPFSESCSHCSRLLCLPNALLGCMAARLDHQKVTMQDQGQLWPVS